MIATLCALYMFYVTDMKLTWRLFNLPYSAYEIAFTYFILDVYFRYKQENM